ncbi:MAG: phosphoribosyltransferase [Chloroflexota bacterium]
MTRFLPAVRPFRGGQPAAHLDAVNGGYRYPSVFKDRREAGQLLATAVQDLPNLRQPIVLALPRGGVPVGFEVARRLHAPLDVLVVRKLGTPGQEELALGAVAFGGASYLNTDLITELQLPKPVLDEIREQELAEVMRRNERYRGDRPWPDLRGRSVIIVDDGAATGATAEAAIAALRSQGPAEIVVALPVAPSDTCERLRDTADRLVCLRSPELFLALGSWYLDFDQVSDEEVRELLRRSVEAAEAA